MSKNRLGEVTKRDFISIAKSLCRHNASSGLISDLGSYFATQNPRFDVRRFEAAASCRVKLSGRRRRRR